MDARGRVLVLTITHAPPTRGSVPPRVAPHIPFPAPILPPSDLGNTPLTCQKIAQLQQRLELASFKTNHGWTDMSINEIETVSYPTTTKLTAAPSLDRAAPSTGGHSWGPRDRLRAPFAAEAMAARRQSVAKLAKAWAQWWPSSPPTYSQRPQLPPPTSSCHARSISFVAGRLTEPGIAAGTWRTPWASACEPSQTPDGRLSFTSYRVTDARTARPRSQSHTEPVDETPGAQQRAPRKWRWPPSRFE